MSIISPWGALPVTGISRPIESAYMMMEGNMDDGLRRLLLGYRPRRD
jgi:hypothetical protein